MKKGLTEKTVEGFLWSFSGTGVQVGLQFLVVIILARLLTPKDFGLIGAAMIIVNFSTMFSQLGIGPALVQRQKLDQRYLCTGFTISLLFGILMSLCILIGAPIISSIFKMNELTRILRILSVVFILQGLAVVAQSLLQKELRFKTLSIINTISYMGGYCIIGIGLALKGFGVWALVIAHVVQQTLNCGLLLMVKRHPTRFTLDLKIAKNLLSFGGGLTIVKISNYFALQGDKFIIGRFLGAEALGYYGRAYQLIMFPTALFGQGLDRVLFPALSQAQNEPSRLLTAYRRGAVFIAFIILPLSGVTFILAPEIVKIVLGPQWGEAILPFRILTLGMFFRIAYKMGGVLARSMGAISEFIWREIVYAMLIILGALIGQTWGINGVAVGTVCAIAANFVLLTQLSIKLIPIKWKDIFTIHIPAILTGCSVFILIFCISLIIRSVYKLPDIFNFVITIGSFLVLMLLTIFKVLPAVSLNSDNKWVTQTIASLLTLRLHKNRKI